MEDNFKLAWEEDTPDSRINQSVMYRSGEVVNVGDSVATTARGIVNFGTVADVTGDAKYGTIISVFFPEDVIGEIRKADGSPGMPEVLAPKGLKHYTPSEWKRFMMRAEDIDNAFTVIRSEIQT